MTEQTETNDADEKGKPVQLVMYPATLAVIDAFAKQEHRSRSNALRVIVEQWAEKQGQSA